MRTIPYKTLFFRRAPRRRFCRRSFHIQIRRGIEDDDGNRVGNSASFRVGNYAGGGGGGNRVSRRGDAIVAAQILFPRQKQKKQQ